MTETVVSPTITLETAHEYFRAASKRGMDQGKFVERQRILDALKKRGMYEAVFIIKQLEENR